MNINMIIITLFYNSGTELRYTNVATFISVNMTLNKIAGKDMIMSLNWFHLNWSWQYHRENFVAIK